MPTSLWASVQDDKIWYYLGSIASRNLVSLYDKMVATSDTSTEMIEASTAITTALESTSTSEQSRTTSDGQTSPTARLYQSLAAGGLGTKPRAHGAESVEMQEAAEQLKALSHVCHRSSDVAASTSPQRAVLPVAMPTLHPGFRNLTHSGPMPVLDSGTGSAGARMRRMLGKPEIRCAHCSHAPFKHSFLSKNTSPLRIRARFCVRFTLQNARARSDPRTNGSAILRHSTFAYSTTSITHACMLPSRRQKAHAASAAGMSVLGV